ncbi:hypothetical protein TNCV_3478301 [Trichonephila clavipes]|nr:hypothetical protein TNCV_3478301 [Trichonephila clavipes]
MLRMCGSFNHLRPQCPNLKTKKVELCRIGVKSAFTSRREQLESVSSTRECSVDICSRLLPLDERLYLAPSASVRNDLSANVSNRIANDFYKSVNIVHIFVCL